jgi:putative glutamine amidotransferase
MDPAYYHEDPHPAAGAAHEARDRCELALARAARDRKIPTLAICRGAQVVNVAFGGSLIQDIPSQCLVALSHEPKNARNDRVHAVTVSAGSRLARALGAAELSTNSSHHQSVRDVAPGLCINARAEDGVIEGLEAADPEWWMVAIQWHPEELTATREDWDRRLFAAFAEEIRREIP